MKSAIKILLILVIISSMGTIYAPNTTDDGGSSGSGNGNSTDATNNDTILFPMDPGLLYCGLLSVSVSQSTVHVNDTVQISVTAENNGLVDWCPLKIYMPVPSDTQFVSFVVPDKNLQNYNPTTGIWDVYRMRHSERGREKTAILTVKILDSAAGKTLPVVSNFNQLVLEGYGVDYTGNVPAARSTSITVLPINNGTVPPGDDNQTNSSKDGTKTGIGDDNTNDNGQSPTTMAGNKVNSNILTNLTSSTDKSLSKSLESGGSGGGDAKAFQIDQVSPISKDDKVSYLIVVILMIGMIVAGYYYGIKKED
jgi:hypothetical protein